MTELYFTLFISQSLDNLPPDTEDQSGVHGQRCRVNRSKPEVSR